MVNGPWSMVDGQWSMVDGPWSMVHGPWSMDHGPFTIHGPNVALRLPMPQPRTRNKTRKRQTQRRRATHPREARASMRSNTKRDVQKARRAHERARVPEMPEEQAKQRTGTVGEAGAIAVSPTGTKHRPIRKPMPRMARSRAKSPSIGRQKQGRVAKRRRGLTGRSDQRAGVGRR